MPMTSIFHVKIQAIPFLCSAFNGPSCCRRSIETENLYHHSCFALLFFLPHGKCFSFISSPTFIHTRNITTTAHTHTHTSRTTKDAAYPQGKASILHISIVVHFLPKNERTKERMWRFLLLFSLEHQYS